MHSTSRSPRRPTHHSRCLWTPSTVEARYAPCSSSSNTAASVRLLPCVVVVIVGGGGWMNVLRGPASVIKAQTHTRPKHTTHMHTYPRCARSECGAACPRAPWWLPVNKLSKAKPKKQHDAAPSPLVPGAWCLLSVRADMVIDWVSPFLCGLYNTWRLERVPWSIAAVETRRRRRSSSATDPLPAKSGRVDPESQYRPHLTLPSTPHPQAAGRSAPESTAVPPSHCC